MCGLERGKSEREAVDMGTLVPNRPFLLFCGAAALVSWWASKGKFAIASNSQGADSQDAQGNENLEDKK